MPILERLENEADFPQNVIFAQSNLMKVHYQLQDYNQSVNYAEKVLASSRTDKNVKSDAHVIIARSAMKTGDEAHNANHPGRRLPLLGGFSLGLGSGLAAA